MKAGLIRLLRAECSAHAVLDIAVGSRAEFFTGVATLPQPTAVLVLSRPNLRHRQRDLRSVIYRARRAGTRHRSSRQPSQSSIVLRRASLRKYSWAEVIIRKQAAIAYPAASSGPKTLFRRSGRNSDMSRRRTLLKVAFVQEFHTTNQLEAARNFPAGRSLSAVATRRTFPGVSLKWNSSCVA